VNIISSLHTYIIFLKIKKSIHLIVKFKMDIYFKFHLSHDGTDVVNALGEGLTAPGHSDGTLRGVG
jgi:hypothetical protein